jgi:superfamily I DNA and RNA helicase
LKSKSEVLGKSLVLLAISENQEYSEEALEFANNINKKYSMYMRDNDELAMSLEKVQGIANRYEAILEDYLYTEEKYRIYQTDKWWQSLVKKQTEIKEIYENLILFRSKIANLESLKEKILKKLNNLPPEFQGQEIPKIRPVVFTSTYIMIQL